MILHLLVVALCWYSCQ